MEFKLQYRKGLLEVKTSGDAELGTFREMMDSMLAHEEWKPGSPFLLDHSELNAGTLTVDDIRGIAGFCAQRRDRFGRAKCAIVVSRDLEFGIGRMWQVFVSNRWDVTEELFKSKDDAREWLSDESP